LEHDKYIIQAKDAELRDVISAYQMLAKEAEVLGSSRDVMERENEGLRQAIRSLEERHVMGQEQIGHLHAREQQLSLDLQSFDHELGQLHRRLQTCQTSEAEATAQSHNHLNTIRGLECTCDELRRNLAELSKQIVIRDNESVLLRVRCDSLEKEIASLSAAHRNDSRRVRELEDANAQLVVRGILSQGPSSATAPQPTSQPRSTSMSSSSNAGGGGEGDVGGSAVRRLERELSEALAANARLDKLARDQAMALSQISQ
jgi:chromosome segregation ATPase